MQPDRAADDGRDQFVVATTPSVVVKSVLETAGEASGTGIRGMSERAFAVGGRLSAGPRADGGFAVRAVLPRRAES